MEVQNTNLVRKQYLMSKQELSKIDAVRVSEKKSAAEVVRDAVRAYNPSSDDSEQFTTELIAFLSSELKSAIDATNAAGAKVNAIVNKLEQA
ncbi:MAG: Arc/MetJ-type ribon-helix-helix transcriptional regulator [Patiriisocius sp.]|jgi:Arc/MetJ-type ribon-helix-helix transcriptional regulator